MSHRSHLFGSDYLELLRGMLNRTINSDCKGGSSETYEEVCRVCFRPEGPFIGLLDEPFITYEPHQ